jgi:ribonuclease Z
MRFDVTILGVGSASPLLGRHPTAQLLTYGHDHYLIDCGEGTQYQLLKYKIKPSHLKYIFISHLHGDHYFGLVGLLSSLNLSGRQEPLWVMGPRGLDSVITLAFENAQSPPNFPIHYTEVETTREYQLFENKHLTIQTIPLQHRIPCAGYLFKEKPNAHLPHLPLRSYAFCSDTRYDDTVANAVQGVSLLYHEATFCDDMAHQAADRFHATARQAAQVAQQANAGKLLLGHFSTRYKTLDNFLTEAQEVFANTQLAEEGVTFEI